MHENHYRQDNLAVQHQLNSCRQASCRALWWLTATFRRQSPLLTLPLATSSSSISGMLRKCKTAAVAGFFVPLKCSKHSSSRPAGLFGGQMFSWSSSPSQTSPWGTGDSGPGPSPNALLPATQSKSALGLLLVWHDRCFLDCCLLLGKCETCATIRGHQKGTRKI